MKIDCGRCPMRARACDDCMMQIFFAGTTSEYGSFGPCGGNGLELADAIDVFADTDLISGDVAEAAKQEVFAGEADLLGQSGRTLRAV